MKDFKTEAIGNLLPGVTHAYNITEDTIQIFDDGITSPTEEEIAAEVTRLQAEYDANQYQRDRAKAYPSLQDQADMQFHDLANGTTTWLDAIQAVKDTYPKPV